MAKLFVPARFDNGSEIGFRQAAAMTFQVSTRFDSEAFVLDWLSEPIDLFTFDFQNDQRWPSATNEVQVTVTQAGDCQGVVQWLWLAVDHETPYENPPLGPKGLRTPHWTPLLYTFPTPQALTKGQVLTLHVVHDRKGARVDLVDVS